MITLPAAMNAEAIETRLWASAVNAAQAAGLEFTVPCAENVRDFIGAGILTMRREGRMSESDLETADMALGRVVGEMIRNTRTLGGQAKSGQVSVIREGALVQAKRLGGLWPFC